jgi:sarcosine oxidase delta subunit
MADIRCNYEKLVDSFKQQGKTHIQASQAAARQDPEAHKEFLLARNTNPAQRRIIEKAYGKDV